VAPFEKRSLLIQVNPDDDTIRVTAGDVMEAAGAEYVDLSSTAFWRDFTGQQFGWGWIVTNQEGNCDGAMLSFGGISPQVLLEVVASSLKMHRVGEAETITDQ
jgi:hypothetical protein